MWPNLLLPDVFSFNVFQGLIYLLNYLLLFLKIFTFVVIFLTCAETTRTPYCLNIYIIKLYCISNIYRKHMNFQTNMSKHFPLTIFYLHTTSVLKLHFLQQSSVHSDIETYVRKMWQICRKSETCKT